MSAAIKTQREADALQDKLSAQTAHLVSLRLDLSKEATTLGSWFDAKSLGKPASPDERRTIEARMRTIEQAVDEAETVCASMRGLLDAWNAGDGKRTYEANKELLVEQFNRGQELEREYLGLIHQAVLVGQELNILRNHHSSTAAAIGRYEQTSRMAPDERFRRDERRPLSKPFWPNDRTLVTEFGTYSGEPLPKRMANIVPVGWHTPLSESELAEAVA